MEATPSQTSVEIISKPIVGDVVLVHGIEGNGTDQHPGIVTRVHTPVAGGACAVSVSVHTDGGGVQWIGGIMFHRSRSDGLAAGKQHFATPLDYPPMEQLPPGNISYLDDPAAVAPHAAAPTTAPESVPDSTITGANPQLEDPAAVAPHAATTA